MEYSLLGHPAPSKTAWARETRKKTFSKNTSKLQKRREGTYCKIISCLRGELFFHPKRKYELDDNYFFPIHYILVQNYSPFFLSHTGILVIFHIFYMWQSQLGV